MYTNHLSALDIQHKMFTPVFNGVHQVKLNQARPQSITTCITVVLWSSVITEIEIKIAE